MARTIFDKVHMNHITTRSRLIRSATWEGLAGPDGSISEEAYEIYSELSRGGIGAVIVGFTSVSQDDSYVQGAMKLSRDELIPQYRRLADTIHEGGCPALIQLALGDYGMTEADVCDVISMFVQAAKRAEQAGFDGVQIHAAHFFFLSRFISPRVNPNPERAQILADILHGIKSCCKNLHVSVKINSSDFMRGGLDEAQSLEICMMLADEGIDSIEVSGNGTSVQGIRPYVNEAYFLKFAAVLAGKVNVPVALVGGLRSIQVMQEILDNTKIELFSLSRPLICEPDLPAKFRDGLGKVSACVSCNACYNSHAHRCVFR